MKMRLINTGWFLFFLLIPYGLYGQSGVNQKYASRELVNQSLQVCAYKTLHLVFPSRVSYVDLGSAEIVASLAPGLDNVLRMKAAQEEFSHETSMAVFLENGSIYDFSVEYKEEPETTMMVLESSERLLTLNGGETGDIKRSRTELVRGAENGLNLTRKDSAASLNLIGGTQDVLREVSQIIYDGIKPHGSIAKEKGYRLVAELQSIYRYKDHCFMDLTIENKSNLPMNLSLPVLRVRNRRVVKRSAISEHEITVLRSHGFTNRIEANSKMRMILAIDELSPSTSEKLEIRIMENGLLQGRSIVLSVLRKDLEQVRQLPISYRR